MTDEAAGIQSERGQGAAGAVHPIQGKRLVFIVGAARSGTTWLQLMLGASAKVTTTRENLLVNAYLSRLFRQWEEHKSMKRHLFRTLTEEQFQKLVRDFAIGVMEQMLATRPDATVIIEKGPGQMPVWRDILTIFPDAYFLHVIRDPRAVAASLLAAQSSWASAWTSPWLIDHCTYWSRTVRYGEEIAAHTKNYLAVRYEDLHERGAPMLQAIFAWAGIDASSEECARIFNDYGIKSIKSRSPSTAQWDVTSSSPGFFRKGETDAWRRDLTKNQIYLIEATTRDAMMRLGYRPETGTGWSWRRVIVWRALIVQRIRAGLEWRLQRWAERLRQRA